MGSVAAGMLAAAVCSYLSCTEEACLSPSMSPIYRKRHRQKEPQDIGKNPDDTIWTIGFSHA